MPDMKDITHCVICGRTLHPGRTHVDTCGNACFHVLLKRQRARNAALDAAEYTRPMGANPLGTSEPMRLDCAWCHTTIRQGPLPISHGICPTCFDREMRNVDALRTLGGAEE